MEGTEAGPERDGVLYARIRRSMRPGCMMVFALDLQRPGKHFSSQQQRSPGADLPLMPIEYWPPVHVADNAVSAHVWPLQS